MNYGQLFCELTYSALKREEEELRELCARNSAARPMSVINAGELAVQYLICKEGLRDKRYPQLIGEMQYEDRKKVDLCFVEDEYPVASFELKFFDLATADECWPPVARDIEKLLDPRNRIKNARRGHQRYNVLLLTTAAAILNDEVEGILEKRIGELVQDPKFIVSDVIELNRLHAVGQNPNPHTHEWNWLRVVAFTGEYGLLAHGTCASG